MKIGEIERWDLFADACRDILLLRDEPGGILCGLARLERLGREGVDLTLKTVKLEAPGECRDVSCLLRRRKPLCLGFHGVARFPRKFYASRWPRRRKGRSLLTLLAREESLMAGEASVLLSVDAGGATNVKSSCWTGERLRKVESRRAIADAVSIVGAGADMMNCFFWHHRPSHCLAQTHENDLIGKPRLEAKDTVDTVSLAGISGWRKVLSDTGPRLLGNVRNVRGDTLLHLDVVISESDDAQSRACGGCCDISLLFAKPLQVATEHVSKKRSEAWWLVAPHDIMVIAFMGTILLITFAAMPSHIIIVRWYGVSDVNAWHHTRVAMTEACVRTSWWSPHMLVSDKRSKSAIPSYLAVGSDTDRFKSPATTVSDDVKQILMSPFMYLCHNILAAQGRYQRFMMSARSGRVKCRSVICSRMEQCPDHLGHSCNMMTSRDDDNIIDAGQSLLACVPDTTTHHLPCFDCLLATSLPPLPLSRGTDIRPRASSGKIRRVHQRGKGPGTFQIHHPRAECAPQ
nr:hypothetical protein CFP56_53284 [Quercus suber]